MSEARIRFFGNHARAFHDDSRLINVEGAVRAGKTTLCLVKILALCQTYPGISGLIGRFSDGDTHRLLKPMWRTVCALAGVTLTWNAEEGYDELSNGSRVYITGLKAQDATSRYAKFRGLTLAFFYIDQAEEMPHDVWMELNLRLSQAGYPHMGLISPQTVGESDWIAEEFPHDSPLKPGRAYYALSMHDNGHNLPPHYISETEAAHPPGTPIHTTLVLGRRGARIIGDPVYGAALNGSHLGAFVRARHEVDCAYDPRVPVEAALDFGKHHPCALFRQVSPTGQTRYLGGVMGMHMHIDPFLSEVLRYHALWFPSPPATAWCCDPAGMTNPIGVDMPALLLKHGIVARHVESSNSPLVRLSCIEHIASRMRARDLAGQEAFLVAKEARWLRISEHGATAFRMLTDGCESGYVWNKHTVSVGNKQVRVPLKDGWYEHAQNCLEYLEANFGYQPPVPTASASQVYRPILRGEMSWAG